MKRIYEREIEPFRRAKENIKYGAALAGGLLYRGAQLYHSSNRPLQHTLVNTPEDLSLKEDAHLAKAAYTSSPVEGFTIDPELTYGNITTYKHNQSGKATVAFAGTRGFDDLKADMAIVGGFEQKDPQFRQALDMTKKAVAKYGLDNVHTTGHSLGGTKSTYVSSKVGTKATTFNQGWFGGALTHATPLGDKWDTSKVKDYVTPGDLISTTTMVTPGRNVTQIQQPEKLNKLKDMFKMKGMEAMARTSIPEILGAAGTAGPAAALAYGAYGSYEFGKREYDLHKMDNFIRPTRPKTTPTQKDRVEARQDRVKVESIAPVAAPVPSQSSHKPAPVVGKLPPTPITYDEQSRVHKPLLLTPGIPSNPSFVYHYGNSHVIHRKGTRHRKTKVSKRRPRHAHTA